MSPSALVLSTAAVLVLGTAALAQVIHVPGDFDTPQEAIDAAPPDAVIRVEGTWDKITIDRPLTLIGPAWFTGAMNDAHFFWDPPITLAGPGSGRLVLSDISTGVEYYQSTYLPDLPPGIQGGGFDELFVLDSTIHAPTFCTFEGAGDCYLNRILDGQPALDTSVPLVVIERSLLRGSRTDCGWGDEPWGGVRDGPPGIRAPASTVIALHSTIRGGPSGDYDTYPSGDCDTYPNACTGSGGPGVVAAVLYHANSDVRGGWGATWNELVPEPWFTPCDCRGPDGVPAITSSPPVALRAPLSMPEPPALGTTLTLVHGGTNGAVLLCSLGLGAPVPTGPGLLFLKAPVSSLGPIANGLVQLTIPANAALIGVRLAFQTLEPRVGFTPPAVGVIR